MRSRPVAITAYNYRQKLGFTYGGNVSRMTWWAYGPNETERSYTYSYDALSRPSRRPSHPPPPSMMERHVQ